MMKLNNEEDAGYILTQSFKSLVICRFHTLLSCICSSGFENPSYEVWMEFMKF
jgi:hypothetical protein